MPQAQRVRRPNRDEVRRRLLDGAAKALVSHGYGAASVEVITEAAGLSRGALYSNFSDKEDLFLELLDQLEQRQITELRAVHAEHQHLGRLLDIISSRSRSSAQDARAHLMVQVELWLLAMRNPAVRKRVVTIQRRSIDAIAEAVSGAAVDLSPTEIAAVVAALSDGLLMQRMLDPQSLRETILTDVLRELARFTGLLPRKRARA